MLRVPGTKTSLEAEMASGADVRIATSPLDAVRWARDNPSKSVIFLGVGFETTSPTIAASTLKARVEGLENFFVYPAFKLLPPALVALLETPDIAIDGFLCPGHVSVMLGAAAYRPVAAKYERPCVIAGFEPLDVLLGLSKLCDQLAENKHEVENAYGRAVSEEGNTQAMEILHRVYEPVDTPWRGLGTIPDSGLGFREEFASFDAVGRFGLDSVETGSEPKGCACPEVLRGLMDPPQCPLFGKACTPESPIGSCMVSSEGSCAAWFKYST
jgi:hydrogenase expression/formation protein HypD